jgi:transposase
MIFPNVERLRVFLRPGATDMRRSINGLAGAVQERMRGDPLSGNLYVFCNRRRSIIKALYWDRTGFCLWLKRLEQDRFRWPRDERECMEITPEQMDWLPRGFDFRAAHESLKFTGVA